MINNKAHFTHGSVVEIVSLSHRVMRSSSVGPPDMNYGLMCNLRPRRHFITLWLCKQADTCFVHLSSHTEYTSVFKALLSAALYMQS